MGFAGNYGSQDGDKTAQRWEVRGQTQYTFTERAYGFGAARYENDEFSQYDYQSTLAGGLGYKIIDTERTKFWVQGGPGYRYAKTRATDESEDGVIFRGDLGFEHQLTDTTKIVERFLVEAGSDNTYLQNDLGPRGHDFGRPRPARRVPGASQHGRRARPSRNTDTLLTVGLLYETK